MPELKIAPSILASDFSRLGEEIGAVIAAGADLIHVDVMDGHFTPNITIGPPVVSALRQHSSVPMDVHLMITNPEDYVEDFANAGADIITFHVEAAIHPHRLIDRIKQLGCRAGIVLNPGTSHDTIEYLVDYVDMVLLMTVNPGFGGQAYIPTMTDKIRRLRHLLDSKKLNVHVQVDGGIHAGNVRELTDAGANLVVVGSAVFGSEDPAAALEELKRCVRS